MVKVPVEVLNDLTKFLDDVTLLVDLNIKDLEDMSIADRAAIWSQLIKNNYTEIES